MKKTVFLIISLLALPCAAQTEVNAFFSGANEGVTYYLPKTSISISVKATCITKTPGEFNRYAERFLRIGNVISKSETYWEMGDISITKNGKPDPEKMFTIKLANGSTACNINVDENGIIKCINTIPRTTAITKSINHFPPLSHSRDLHIYKCLNLYIFLWSAYLTF